MNIQKILFLKTITGRNKWFASGYTIKRITYRIQIQYKENFLRIDI
jgi:hypothetical protein